MKAMRRAVKVAVVAAPIAAIAFFMLAPVLYFPTTVFNGCTFGGCTHTYSGYESLSCKLFHMGSGYYTKVIVTSYLQSDGGVTVFRLSTAYFLSCPEAGYDGGFA